MSTFSTQHIQNLVNCLTLVTGTVAPKKLLKVY